MRLSGWQQAGTILSGVLGRVVVQTRRKKLRTPRHKRYYYFIIRYPRTLCTPTPLRSRFLIESRLFDNNRTKKTFSAPAVPFRSPFVYCTKKSFIRQINRHQSVKTSNRTLYDLQWTFYTNNYSLFFFFSPPQTSVFTRSQGRKPCTKSTRP